MKKIVYGILTAMLGLCCLTACKGKDTDSSSSVESTSQETVSNIRITQSEVELTVGSSVQLEAETTKQNVYVFWSVRDDNIATVSNGVLTGVSEGETICYATFGGETAMCLVKVYAEVAQPMLSISTPYASEPITLNEGDTFNPLVMAKLGDTAINDAVFTYDVEDTDVVTVVDGELVAMGVGDTSVLIKVTYNSQVASVELTVKVVEAVA